MAGFRDVLRTFFSPPPTVQRGLTADRIFGSSGDEWVSTTAGVAVTADAAMRHIAVQAAVRLLTNDIASLPVDAFRAIKVPAGDGDLAVAAKKELRRPSWVNEPVPNNPNVTWEDHVKAVVYSMLTDGNAFTYCFPSVFNVQAIRVLDPKTVDIKGQAGFGDVVYKVDGVGELSPFEVLHLPWVVPPGKNRGLNPIETAKQGLGIALAADEFVGAYFGNGAILSGHLEFPEGVEVDAEKLKPLLAGFTKKHVGSRKSHLVGALTGGAKYVEHTYSNQGAQLHELREDIVEDVARLFGIPPHMLGSQKPGAVAFASIEQRSIDYVTHAVLPIVRRIEVGYSRLLRGQQTYLRFNLEGLKRGDQAARAKYYETMLTNKAIRREEVRALEDLPFDSEGVGYLETPNNNPPAEPSPPAEPADRTLQFYLPEQRTIAEVHVPAATVNVAPAEVRVNVPAPVVNVAAAEAPIVNVAAAEAPVVNIAAPDLAPITRAVAGFRDDITSLRADVRKPRKRRLLTDAEGNVIGSEEE